MEKEVASEETKHVVHPINMRGWNLCLVTMRGIEDHLVILKRSHFSTSISVSKIAAVMLDHWNPTADNET